MVTLHELDSREWDKVVGPYGPAPELREALTTLAEGDARARRRALESISDLINHQDLITPAAEVVTPYLVQLASNPTFAERAAVTALLGKLAVGGSEVRFTLDGRPAELDPELAPICATLRGSLLTWLDMLKAEDASVRTAAAFLLGLLRASPAATTPALLEAVERERNATARASAVLAIAYLAGAEAHDREAAAVARVAADGKGVARSAARIALCLLAPERVDEDACLELLALAESKSQTPGLPWFDGEIDNFATVVVADLLAARGNAELLLLLLDAVKNKPTFRRATRRVFDAVFARDPAPSDMRLVSDLSVVQRQVLEALVERKLIFAIDDRLRASGMFGREDELARWLGRTPAGPLDRVVSGNPLWRRAVAVLSGRAPRSTWTQALEGLGPEEVVAVCRDAGRGVYPLDMLWPPASPWPSHADRLRRGALAMLLAETLVGARVPRPMLVAEADEMVAKGAPLGAAHATIAWTAALAVALSERATEGALLEAPFDALLHIVLDEEAYADAGRRVLARFPIERREVLVRDLAFGNYCEEDGRGGRFAVARGRWLYADMCPTQATVADVIAAIAGWPEKELVPEVTATDVLRAIAPAAPALVEEATRSQNPRVARVARQARETAA